MNVYPITNYPATKQNFGAYPKLELDANELLIKRLSAKSYRKMAKFFLKIEDNTPFINEIRFSLKGKKLVANINRDNSTSYEQFLPIFTRNFIKRVCKKAVKMNKKLALNAGIKA